MDIQNQASQWAKSTENRIQLFFDDYLIRSSNLKVRGSSQRLILSLFKKGNQQQRLKIMGLIQSRCQQLVWMGKASEDFLNLVKNIFSATTNYSDQKSRIIKKIFANLEEVHNNMVTNPNYQFYSFASNLIDFGNQEFKPYLLQVNGCLNCSGKTQPKSEQFRIQNCLQLLSVFTNKIQYLFKRIYDVKQLTINLRAYTQFNSGGSSPKIKHLNVFYLDENKQQKLIGKYKPAQAISMPFVTLQGIIVQLELHYPNIYRRKLPCVFCQKEQQGNNICSSCSKRTDLLQIGGTFRPIGADESIITEELCQDYQRIQQNLTAIRNLHDKMQSKQKISLNFRLDEMVDTYQRIVNNLSMLHQKNPSQMKAKDNQNCFSCNYYQIINIIKFLKETIKKFENLTLQQNQIKRYKEILRNCLCNNQMQSLKVYILEAIATFIVNVGKPNFKEQFQNKNNKFVADLISKTLVALKQKRNLTQTSIQDELNQIRAILQQKSREFKIQQKIKIFVSYFLDWDLLSLVLSDSFNHTTQINRLTSDQFHELKSVVDFDLAEVFNLTLDSYLKAFLKIIPENILPSASLDIVDCQFLQYVDNKIPEIQKKKIEQSIICCPHPIIRLNMFASLPILISKLPVKQSMKVMNSLFPYRNVWNLNIIKACKKFDQKLTQLSPEQQISMCLQGYCRSKEYLYIEKIYKLLVPQRLQMIVRLEAPHHQIEQAQVQYPFLPIREIKTKDLQGDNIKALHDWIYNQLCKINQNMPLDIIVEKSIIDNMDFPIQLIYQNIAENKSKKRIGQKQYDLFRVIYRVQGILGEPKQRSIANQRDQKLQTCNSYASYFLNKFSEDFSKKIGLDVMIQILESIKPGLESQEKKILLFEILSALSINQAICKKIVQGQYGDSIINATVRLMSFENEKDAKITNFLLQLSSKVIDEANQEMINLRKGSVGEYRKMSGGMEAEQTTTISQSQNKVKYVLQKIKQCQSTYQKTKNVLYRDIAKKLIKLLPFCSKDEHESTLQLFNYFQFTNWSKYTSKSQNLFIFVDSLSESYMTFKSLAKQKGVTSQITNTIKNAIRKQGTEQIDEKKLSVNRSLTESALLLLCALVQGDENLQEQLFDSKIFHNIYQISQIPPKKALQINAGRVPENCYKIIKYLGEGKIIQSRISSFLEEKKKIQKQRTQPRKSKKWETIKNKQKTALLNKIQEQGQQSQKDLIICSSCQEGYNRRKQILGVYIYLVKNEIPIQNVWWKDNRRIPSLSSTTYFTAIHYDCHMRAYEADQKIGRNQWDGALIRNMDILCNSWIPFKGPKTTTDEFTRVQRKYFERNKNGNYWNVLNDLQTLLSKLSIQFDFAKESKGSSSSHNCRYIPVLIGFTCHMIERAGGCNHIQEGIAYLKENPPKKLSTMNLMMCYSIFALNYNEFVAQKPKFLQMIKSLKTEQVPEDKYFQMIKPHLVFLKMIDQIFQIIHKPMYSQSSQQKIYKQLNIYIGASMQQLVPQFEALSTRYKTKYLKYANAAQFQF